MDLKTLEETPPWEWPKDTDKMLLDILRKGRIDASDRILAVQLAGESTVVNDELARALLSVAQNDKEDQEVRSAALIALGPALEQADMMGFDEEDYIVVSEEVFRLLQTSLQKLYMNPDLPKDVRRAVLEAAVRAPQQWQYEAVRAAYTGNDDDWRLTAIFCMGYLDGFDVQIMEALGSNDPDIHFHAVCAAGNWDVHDAWPHIAALVRSEETDKDLRIAAIGALAGIRPEESAEILNELIDSEDEDIVEAVFEALAMSGGLTEFEGDGFEDDEENS
ncbi:MAG: HEAT repeat domain-containing protein [Desulfatitalea sp.]|nr:HEAT repeat domain-containing protein [Desulfatitalea sp.]